MIRTLRTLLRASQAEVEERLVDARGPELLAQHLRDANADVTRGRRSLAALEAQRKAEERRATALAEEIFRRETDAARALEAEEEALAGDIADRIAGLEEERERAREASAALTGRAGELRTALAEAERKLAGLASELRAARAGRIWREARGRLVVATEPSALEQATDLAQRIGETGRRLDDELSALETPPMTAGDDLDARMAEAGLAPKDERRAAILARIKTRTASKGDDT